MNDNDFDELEDYQSTGVKLLPKHKRYAKNNNINLSKYLRDKLDEDMDKKSQKKKLKDSQFITQQMVMIALGFILFAMIRPNSLIGLLFPFAMGACFTLYGSVNLILFFRRVRKSVKKKNL